MTVIQRKLLAKLPARRTDDGVRGEHVVRLLLQDVCLWVLEASRRLCRGAPRYRLARRRGPGPAAWSASRGEAADRQDDCAGLGEFVPTAVASVSRSHPRVQLELQQLEPESALPALRAGDLDLAVTYHVGAAEDDDRLEIDSLARRSLRRRRSRRASARARAVHQLLVMTPRW